jgi:acyl-CoA synthetase (AMP-forming)/AMP-acid ligase II
MNPYPVDTIHGAFVAAANAHPDAIAVLGNDDDGTPNLSFRQLVNLCQCLAQHLTRTSSSTHARCGPAIFRAGDSSPGIAVGASVAVSLDSSIELIVAYFAVLMAGKAFAPLETTLPPAALTGVISALHEHANLTHHIVSARKGDTGEPDHPIRSGRRTLAIRLSKTKSHPGDDDADDTEPRLEVHERGVPVTVIRCADTSDDIEIEMEDLPMPNTTRGGPDDVAHVIHTGGSTGAPKAVVCAHRGSLASHAARTATHPYVADDVTGVCVFGVWDAVCALLAGSKVAMLPPGSITDGGDVLGRYLCDNKVTRTMLTPSLAELLVAAAAHAESVHAREALDVMRVVVLCGETPRVGLVDALLSSQPDETDEEYSNSPRVVANLYSVSEAHDVALERNLGSAVQEGLTSTCGVPYGHVHLAIADDDGCVLTEAESEGWLHIAGDGVASGYLGPHGWEATRRAFVPRTWLDGVTRTWYATGDRAKVRTDGRLVLLGRGAGAGRVKIRGKLVR